MITQKETAYTVDSDKKQIKVVREFDGTVEKVWKAWTDPKILDKWWAPKPWKANTKSMDLREGGKWLYYMEGPDGSKQHCGMNYEAIVPNKMFQGKDFFCDEKGNPNNELPTMHWKVSFNKSANGTRVEIDITFNSEADLNTIVQMGFKEGFAAAHSNLDELLVD
jgi:uncharacterized protein YndB with AHSA1/START domain